MSFLSFKIKQLTSQVKTFNFLPFIFQNLIFKHFYSQFWFGRSEFVISCTRKTEMLISLLITIYLWIFILTWWNLLLMISIVCFLTIILRLACLRVLVQLLSFVFSELRPSFVPKKEKRKKKCVPVFHFNNIQPFILSCYCSCFCIFRIISHLSFLTNTNIWISYSISLGQYTKIE